jgi:hypothetical protein
MVSLEFIAAKGCTDKTFWAADTTKLASSSCWTMLHKLHMRQYMELIMLLQDALDLNMPEMDGASRAAHVLHFFAQLGTYLHGAHGCIGPADAYKMEMQILSRWCSHALGRVSTEGFFGLHRFTSTWC